MQYVKDDFVCVEGSMHMEECVQLLLSPWVADLPDVLWFHKIQTTLYGL